MNESGFPILSLVVFLPAIGGLLVAYVGRSRPFLARWLALAAALIETALGIALLLSYSPTASGPQLVERASWIPTIGAEYYLAVDGISLYLLFLTILLSLLAIVGGWREMESRPGPYAGSLLFLTAGVNGAFASQDLLLFFVFWEAMLIPMYILVATCGGPRRAYAAIKFFIYTTVGSLLMLLGVISLHLYHLDQTNASTFSLVDLASPAIPADAQIWLFLAFAIAFAIKVPVFPLHTWIRDLYTQTPLAALVLATMLVKVGGYGLIRFAITYFPVAAAEVAPIVGILALIGIFYGGIVAAAQRNLVAVMAYSSVSQLGFVVLGVFSLTADGINGAVLQMINHGISAGAIFVILSMILARTGSLDLGDDGPLGGLAARWPVMAAFLTISVFSAAGLPGLNGFVGEFLILFGAYQTYPALAFAGAAGVVVSAVYLLRLYRGTMNGPAKPAPAVSFDLTAREIAVLVPLAAAMILIGLFPISITGVVGTAASAQLALAGIDVASTPHWLAQMVTSVTP